MSSKWFILWCCLVSMALIRMVVRAIMKNIFYGAEPPWGSKVKWQIVNRDLDYLIYRHYDVLKDAVMLARDLQVRMVSIFSLLDDLCWVTCPWCPDPCCLAARVWIDFKDLLFLHLAGHPVPPEQLLSDFKESCRYWSPRGCMLPRISRPWVCTWHLCPTQKVNLRRKAPSVQEKMRHAVQRITAGRKVMETEFIRIVS
jgi:hypothetical protein